MLCLAIRAVTKEPTAVGLILLTVVLCCALQQLRPGSLHQGCQICCARCGPMLPSTGQTAGSKVAVRAAHQGLAQCAVQDDQHKLWQRGCPKCARSGSALSSAPQTLRWLGMPGCAHSGTWILGGGRGWVWRPSMQGDHLCLQTLYGALCQPALCLLKICLESPLSVWGGARAPSSARTGWLQLGQWPPLSLFSGLAQVPKVDPLLQRKGGLMYLSGGTPGQ